MWVEAESSKIGQVHLPNELWQAMKTAGGVELDVTADERAAYLLRTYRHFVDDPDELKRLVRRLRHRLSEEVIGEWCEAVDAGRWVEFVADVLEKHYDPAYRHSRERDFPHVTEVLRVGSLSDDGIRQVAAGVEDLTPRPPLPWERGCSTPEPPEPSAEVSNWHTS